MKDFRAIGMTAVAVAILSVVMLSYVHSFIYTRIEAEKLEQRVDSEFEKVNDKLDSLVNLFHQKLLQK